ncbi:CinA family protein [Pedobacter sp.]
MNITELTLDELSKRCKNATITIAAAESVTAGYLQFLLSQMPSALDIFNGGITAYNIGQKVKHLNLDYIEAAKCNCVSKETAETMAIKAAELFNSKMGIGITGYASPVPEKDVTELYAYMAIYLNNKVVHSYKLHSKETSAAEAQKDYALQVVTEVLSYLEGIRS